jgi:hypothetical protein
MISSLLKIFWKSFLKKIGEQYIREDEAGYQRAEEKGIVVETVSPAELQKFKDKLEPLVNKWIDDMEEKGLPGREVYEQIKSTAEKYK